MQMQQAPSTAATVERKKNRRQNTSENRMDRATIIEMAQQIVLPPIRETECSQPSYIMQQQ